MGRTLRGGLLFLFVVSCGRSPETKTEAAPAPQKTNQAEVIRTERVSETTRLLHRADGTSTAVISAGATAFKDADGQWQDIMPVLEADKGGGFVAQRNSVRARFPAMLGNGAAVRIEDARGGLGFRWIPSWTQPVAVTSDGTVARYALGGELEGAVEEFHIVRGGLKHNLVLNDRAVVDRAMALFGSRLPRLVAIGDAPPVVGEDAHRHDGARVHAVGLLPRCVGALLRAEREGVRIVSVEPVGKFGVHKVRTAPA